MTGHSKPDRLQIFATYLAMMAFAICTQFQVMRKSMSCTAAMAMWAASAAALRGMIPDARISEASTPASAVISSNGKFELGPSKALALAVSAPSLSD